MTSAHVLVDLSCRPPAQRWVAVREPAHRVEAELDRFAASTLETIRRGIAQESREALALLPPLGLEVPCARPTT